MSIANADALLNRIVTAPAGASRTLDALRHEIASGLEHSRRTQLQSSVSWTAHDTLKIFEGRAAASRREGNVIEGLEDLFRNLCRYRPETRVAVDAFTFDDGITRRHYEVIFVDETPVACTLLIQDSRAAETKRARLRQLLARSRDAPSDE